MASKIAYSLPGGVDIGDAYAVVSHIGTDRLRARVNAMVSVFRDADTRRAYAARVAARAAQEAALATANAAVAKASKDADPDTVDTAMEARRAAIRSFDAAAQAMDDPRVQPLATIAVAVSGGVLAAGSFEQIVAAVYAELKSAGGVLAAGIDC